MEKYRDMSIRKKSNLKMIRNLILFFVLILFTFWFIFKDQDLNELVKVIKSVDLRYIIIGVIFMLFVYLTEAYNLRKNLIELGDKKISVFKALKLTWIGFFFSSITPGATGGQPIEIYYMTKEKISVANGTIAMLLQLCGFQISTIFISIVFAFLYPSILRDGIIWFYLLGIVLNSLVLLFLLIVLFSKKITKKLVNILIKCITIAKVKNIAIKKKKILEGLEQYSESAKYIKSHKGQFIKSVSRVFIQIILYYSITYFVYRAFNLTSNSFFDVFAMQAILYTTVSSLPLPGSIGVSETLFLKIFGGVFGKILLGGAMLIYRFISFYLYIIISAIFVVITAIKTKNIIGEVDKNIKEIEAIV